MFQTSPPDLSWNHAMEMLRLVIDEADTRGMALSICIRDRHDNLVAHVRMKNALLGSVDLSCMKARTSALFPFPSVAIAQFEALQFTNGIISPIEVRYLLFLTPTGAQEMTMFVCLSSWHKFVRSTQSSSFWLSFSALSQLWLTSSRLSLRTFLEL